MTIKYSIIIPCYNEAKNIPLNLKRYQEVIKRADVELILVDNGSSDGSDKILVELLPQYPFARSIRVEVNQGYGFGILQGLKAARGEILAWTHADMQTDPADVLRAAEIMDQQKDPQNTFIKGNRKNRPYFDQVFEKGMCLFESLLFGKWLHDINAQPNMFHREFFKQWQNPPHDVTLDLYLYIIAQTQKLNIVRFPVLFPERIHGESKFHTSTFGKIKVALKVMSYSIKLKKFLKKVPWKSSTIA